MIVITQNCHQIKQNYDNCMTTDSSPVIINQLLNKNFIFFIKRTEELLHPTITGAGSL